MLHTIPREAAAYDALYKGKTLLIKVSGAEIGSEDFPILIRDIRTLVSKGVRIILVFGGGDQINRSFDAWRSEQKVTHGIDIAPREKIHGMGVTSPDVLEHGVLPAHEDIRKKFADALPEGTILAPGDIRCGVHPDSHLGSVGIPREIALPESDITIVGFVGTVNDGAQPVNVNADDLALQILRQERQRIEELIFLTGTGCILDRNEGRVTLLTSERIRRILDQEDPHIHVDGGMQKKLMEVLRALQETDIDKVIITKTGELLNEIETWMGTGTLCFHPRHVRTGCISIDEEPIFDAVCEELARQGKFRKRTAEELLELKRHHRMVRVKSTPLGGFSLVPRDGWLELSALWAGTVGNGMGKLLLDQACEEAGEQNVYALTADPQIAGRTFGKHPHFHSEGKLSEAKAKFGEALPTALQEYDTNERDPWLFISLGKYRNHRHKDLS